MERLFIAPSNVRLATLPWQAAGLTYTATGYGKKIPTRYQVRHANRWRRVYSTCYSNVGSAWIIVDGAQVFVDFDPVS